MSEAVAKTGSQVEYAAELQGLVQDPSDIIDGARFWVVVAMRDAKALAAWVDENGELHTKIYTSVAAAVRKASTSWGR